MHERDCHRFRFRQRDRERARTRPHCRACNAGACSCAHAHAYASECCARPRGWRGRLIRGAGIIGRRGLFGTHIRRRGYRSLCLPPRAEKGRASHRGRCQPVLPFLSALCSVVCISPAWGSMMKQLRKLITPTLGRAGDERGTSATHCMLVLHLLSPREIPVPTLRPKLAAAAAAPTRRSN